MVIMACQILGACFVIRPFDLFPLLLSGKPENSFDFPLIAQGFWPKLHLIYVAISEISFLSYRLTENYFPKKTLPVPGIIRLNRLRFRLQCINPVSRDCLFVKEILFYIERLSSFSIASFRKLTGKSFRDSNLYTNKLVYRLIIFVSRHSRLIIFLMIYISIFLLKKFIGTDSDSNTFRSGFPSLILLLLYLCLLVLPGAIHTCFSTCIAKFWFPSILPKQRI